MLGKLLVISYEVRVVPMLWLMGSDSKTERRISYMLYSVSRYRQSFLGFEGCGKGSLASLLFSHFLFACERKESDSIGNAIYALGVYSFFLITYYNSVSLWIWKISYAVSRGYDPVSFDKRSTADVVAVNP